MRLLIVEDDGGYDAIVLYFNVPGKDGLAVLRSLRDAGSSLPTPSGAVPQSAFVSSSAVHRSVISACDDRRRE